MRKTNRVNEVELNYYNCEDEHNRFKGLIKFPNVYCVKFANVLCNNEEMVQKYINEYYNPDYEYPYEVINSLQDYKRDILIRRNDVGEYRDKIKNCIETENWQYLWVVLQDLFLEPLAKEQLDSIVRLIHSGLDENDIINWYEKGKKVLALITFDISYIKSL